MNYFKYYSEFVKTQEVEGYSNGFKFEDFKKGDKVGVFVGHRVMDIPQFVEGKIVKIERALNANGKDTIRNISVDLGDMKRQVSGHGQIKNHLFKKDEPLDVKPELKTEVIETEEGFETVIVERAMSVKNPTVQKYLKDGWLFIGREWNAALNMYLATLKRAISQ